MKKNKVVFIINSMGGGGAEKVVAKILNYLCNSYDCYLILMENEKIYDLDSRINILYLDENSSYNSCLKFFRLPIIAYKLSRLLKKYQFKKVVSFMYRANYVNILSQFFFQHKVVISERIAPSSMYFDNSPKSLANKLLIRLLYNKADLIISVAKAIKKDLIENFNIIVENKVIYNPYDVKKIKELSYKSAHIYTKKEKNIISIGSLTERKNHESLIRAFARTEKDSFLYILGVGKKKKKLEQLVNELDVVNRVFFLGFQKNPYKFLDKCSIFVLSSRSEGFPNALVEAMACGCAIISTDCLSGPREIADPLRHEDKLLLNNYQLCEYGILTPLNNDDKLSECITLLLQDERLRQKYSEKSSTRAMAFDFAKIIKKYEELICVE